MSENSENIHVPLDIAQLLCRIILCIYIIILTVLSLLPAKIAVASGYGDKWEHFVAYCALSCLARTSFRKTNVFKIWLVCSAYGGVLELLQHFSPGRCMDFLDFGVNTIGALSCFFIKTRINR